MSIPHQVFLLLVRGVAFVYTLRPPFPPPPPQKKRKTKETQNHKEIPQPLQIVGLLKL